MSRYAIEVANTSSGVANREIQDPQVTRGALPDRYTLHQLHNNFAQLPIQSSEEKLHTLVAFESALRSPDRLEHCDDDAVWIQLLSLWLSQLITPGADLATEDQIPDKNHMAGVKSALDQFKQISTLGLTAMRFLQSMLTYRVEDFKHEVLLSLLAFTNLQDSWNSELSHSIAIELLRPHDKVLFSHGFIVEFVLGTFIRPLYSKSKPAAITSTGRKALNPTSTNANFQGYLDPSSKPWKFKEVSAVTVFSWAVSNANENMISQSWNLFIPPVLTILDDPSTDVRVRGMLILRELLSKTDARMLKQTGLGEVFEDVLMPTLLFLPSLTPANESLRLLKPAYSALFELGDVRFPREADLPEKIKFLDRIMRQGLLQGILHSQENVVIMTLLMNMAAVLIQMMGIHSAKYLKDILPIISSILTDPLAFSQMDLLLAGIRAAQSTVLSCWPRLSEDVHRIQLINAFAVCWGGTGDGKRSQKQGNSQLVVVQEELKIAGKMLVESVGGEVDIEKELEPLFRFDQSLYELFGFEDSREK